MNKEITMLPPPDKQDIELEVSSLFQTGDIKNIARYVQRDSGLVSKLLSANCDDKNNVVYFAILFLWAFDCIRRELGDAIVNIILRERAKWLVSDQKRAISPAKLTSNVGKEYIKAIEKELSGAGYDEQIKEWMDVEMAARDKKQAVIDTRNDAYFNGHVRNFSRRAVQNRR